MPRNGNETWVCRVTSRLSLLSADGGGGDVFTLATVDTSADFLVAKHETHFLRGILRWLT